MLNAWNGLPSLRDVSALRPWLFRVLQGVLTEHHRTKRRRLGLVPVISLPEGDDARLPAADKGPFDALMEGVSSRDVREALGRIPEEFAAAVELHDMHELKYREISEVLDLPMGTVMSRIFRGRLALARELANDDSEYQETVRGQP